MNKIGIITYHKTTNIGATLQAYALEKKIEELGGIVEIIDYQCDNINDRELPHKPTLKNGFKSFLRSILRNGDKKRKFEVLQVFVDKNCKVSNKTYYKTNIKEANNEYSKFIVGSDIVWELYINGEDYTYFLDFADSNKRFSYAASFGYSDIPSNFKNKVAKELSKFKILSVREERGKAIIKDCINQKAELVADPTLLLNEKEWDKISSERIIPEKYIVLYFLDKKKKILNHARKLSKQYGYKIILISDTKLYFREIKKIKYCSIPDFLSLIKHAEFILTASYHGLLFSLNYGKNFLYFNRAHSDRMDTIVDLFDLKDRNLNLTDFCDDDLSERYKEINIKLEKFKNSSINYITQILNENNNEIKEINNEY